MEIAFTGAVSRESIESYFLALGQNKKNKTGLQFLDRPSFCLLTVIVNFSQKKKKVKQAMEADNTGYIKPHTHTRSLTNLTFFFSNFGLGNGFFLNSCNRTARR